MNVVNVKKPNMLRAFVIAAVVLIAAPAFATTSVHEDLLGIGDPSLGYVGAGETLEYQHFFAPATDAGIEISSIDSVWLEVAVFDDSRCSRLLSCVGDWLYESEVAAIDLNGIDWQTGSATARLFLGEISAEANLLVNDGILNVDVTSQFGDFTVLWSRLQTTYTWDVAGGGGSGTPMPEPSAALVFAVGALVVQRRIRRGARTR